MSVTHALERYQANYRAEQEAALLYQELARTEQEPHLAELYHRMSETEQRHANVWAERLRSAGQPVPHFSPTWRIRALIWLAKRFGVSSVLPMISTMERKAVGTYETQPEAQAAGMQASERSHVHIFREVQTSTHGGIAGPVLARFEGRHRATSGGNALRAVIADGAGAGTFGDMAIVDGQGFKAPVALSVDWLSMRATELLSGVPEPPALVSIVGKIHVPVLLIASDKPGELTDDQVYRARIGANATLWSVPDAGYVEALQTHCHDYTARVTAFLTAALFHII